MALRSDHKALLFLGVVAVLGAGVRVVRAANGRAATGVQPALEQQSQAADSSARAGRGSRAKERGTRSGAKQDVASRRSTRASRDSISARERSARVRAADGLLDHPGYVGGKLDLDIATAAQVDSLPGVGPTMAKRIVVDRMKRGPFVTRDGFRRVPGVGPAFLAKIDSLVVFSGTVRFPAAGDTVIPRGRRSRK